jgi:hypothetical protein
MRRTLKGGLSARNAKEIKQCVLDFIIWVPCQDFGDFLPTMRHFTLVQHPLLVLDMKTQTFKARRILKEFVFRGTEEISALIA